MSPEVILAKIQLLQQILSDLKPHITETRTAQERYHYEIERQVQIAVDLCISIGRRILIINGAPTPEHARDTFFKLADLNLLKKSLAERLSAATGLRNLIVHEYGKLDYSRFFGDLKEGFMTFEKFIDVATGLMKSSKRK